MYATYSATSEDGTPVTPTPPTTWPFLKIGTPPGFTAVGSLSSRSAFPVAMPSPGLAPLIVVAGGTVAARLLEIVQPRFVFSMPYSAALAVVHPRPDGK